MKNDLIVNITRAVFPLIIALAFYIQINGSDSPGGGFQAGVIMASAFILFSLVFGEELAGSILSVQLLKSIAVLGIFLYAGTGALCMIYGGDFLQYSTLANSWFEKQTLGISMIEWGVGLTVFSVFSLIYYVFATLVRKN